MSGLHQSVARDPERTPRYVGLGTEIGLRIQAKASGSRAVPLGAPLCCGPTRPWHCWTDSLGDPVHLPCEVPVVVALGYRRLMPLSSSRPAGAPQVLPYLYYPDAARALAFLVDAFGFTELEALRDDEGRVWSTQVSTGDGVVLIGPEMTEFGTRSVTDSAWATSRTFVYVHDLDVHYEHARASGATIITGPADHGPNRIYIAGDCGGQQWIFASPLS